MIRRGTNLSTQQGYSPWTCWSRGLAWAIYGFHDTFLYTGEKEFLETAELCAQYYFDHPTEDGVPYWDYGAPNIPEEEKDSSAAAVIASGVLGKEAGPAKVAERLEQTARLPAYAEGDSSSGFGAGIVDLGRATNPDVRTD